jgi:hypothetical protein
VSRHNYEFVKEEAFFVAIFGEATDQQGRHAFGLKEWAMRFRSGGDEKRAVGLRGRMLNLLSHGII